MLNRVILFSGLLVASVVSTGCESKPPTAEVTGTVTFEGKPLAKGTIIFESPGNRPANGKIIDGKIVDVTTYEAGDGATVGEHKVAIQATEDAGSAVSANPGEATPGANYMGGKSLLPEAYGDPATSNLTATIKEGTNTVKFELKKNP